MQERHPNLLCVSIPNASSIAFMLVVVSHMLLKNFARANTISFLRKDDVFRRLLYLKSVCSFNPNPKREREIPYPSLSLLKLRYLY